MRYVVIEGLPALGKSEALALLARFYPERVAVFPELVKEVAEREKIDIFAERERLTAALIAALPRRQAAIEAAIAAGKLCLEESHLGVHLAYAQALGDTGFVEAYDEIEDSLLSPDLYIRLAAPIEVSIARQNGRNTPEYFIDAETLGRMLSRLDAWHIARRTRLVTVDADRDPAEFIAELEQILGLGYVSGEVRVGDVFPLILLLGRPASGKSEFIDFMKKTPLSQRATRYHIGNIRVIDDFPILWEKFIEDDIWEKLGRGRLHSRPADGNYAVVDPLMWAFLTEKLDIAVRSAMRESGPGDTLIVEFSRGREHGYREALMHLSSGVLRNAAILYIDVSFAESTRRNRARYDEAARDSILTHSVPGEEMEETYKTDDWKVIAPEPHGKLTINGIDVPYVTMKNEPELTDPVLLDKRYGAALSCLAENSLADIDDTDG